VAGYTIPIDTALAVPDQITSGVDNATIHQGVPAFLGIQTAPASANGFGQGGLGSASTGGSTGAAVDGVVSGSGPAD
jgi:hypothetical protein